MKSIFTAFVLTLAASSSFAAGWIQMNSVCFEGPGVIDAKKIAMEKCQAFLKDFMQMQNDHVVVQAYCQEGSYPACGQGFPQKAELKAKFMQIEQPLNCQ